MKEEQEKERLKQEMEELWAVFTTEKEKLEIKYQKQVDDMCSFDYRCCMKKHDMIMRMKQQVALLKATEMLLKSVLLVDRRDPYPFCIFFFLFSRWRQPS